MGNKSNFLEKNTDNNTFEIVCIFEPLVKCNTVKNVH